MALADLTAVRCVQVLSWDGPPLTPTLWAGTPCCAPSYIASTQRGLEGRLTAPLSHWGQESSLQLPALAMCGLCSQGHAVEAPRVSQGLGPLHCSPCCL